MPTLLHRCEAPSRIRHKLKVFQRRLYRRVPQPATQVVDRYPVHQQVPCILVPQSMTRYAPPRWYRASFHCLLRSRSYPPVRSGSRCLDESVPVHDIPELERTGKSGVEFGMDARFSALLLAPPHVDRWQIRVQRQVADLECQRLRYPETGAPLDHEQETCPRVRGGAYQCVNLVSF